MVADSSIKERGAHFTPADMAEYIASRALGMLDATNEYDVVIVLDPACGDGELLIAALKYLHDHGRKAHLIGIDTDQASLDEARKRLTMLLLEDDVLDLRCTNFLECFTSVPETLFSDDSLDELGQLPLVDAIIANPPYVRTQVMGAEASQSLSKKYKLSGKVDLYHAFFINYARFLKPNGVLGVITSNRYLYTKSGAVVRKCLAQEFDIDYIVDLGDTKIFAAAVLPALFFGRPKKGTNKPIPCTRVYETLPAKEAILVSSVVDILNSDDGIYSIEDKSFIKESGHIRNSSEYHDSWILASSEQESWLDSIDAASFCRIQDVGKVRVGVKTTADNVFIRDDWDSLDELQPETEWMMPLISSENTDRWHANIQPSHQILYPYYSNSGKRQVAELSEYPHMKDYLESFYSQLSSRTYVTKANRQWYEIWVPQDPSAWKRPKVVFPDISSNARFLIDDTGSIVDGNCYWIQVDNDNTDLLYLIAAVANSKLMDKYHSLAFQNVLYSGKRRYLTQYVSKYPIPDPTSDASAELIDYVKTTLSKGENIDDGRIDELVASAFGI